MVLFCTGIVPLSATDEVTLTEVTDRLNPEAVCNQLTAQYRDGFYFDSALESGKFKFKSETGNRIVWMFFPSQSVYLAEGINLLKSRFDNLGQENSVFHLHVQDKSYKLHLNESTACLVTKSDTPKAHVDLIKAWVATFRGQPISSSLVVRTE
jgi:hypothetical protein